VLAQHDSMQYAPAYIPQAPAANEAAGQTGSATMVVNETIAGGTHTYSGTFIPKAACDSFGSGIKYSAAGGGHVSVILITAPSATACAQAASANVGEPFSVSIKLGPGSAPIFDGVLLNGSPIPSQLMAGN